MKKYKSVFLLTPKMNWGAIINITDTEWYFKNGYIEIDRDTLPRKYYEEFRNEYFRPFSVDNPTTLDATKEAFEVFKQQKLTLLQQEHQASLARKREGKKFDSVLMLSRNGQSMYVYEATRLAHAETQWGEQVIDVYNYPNHYYRAFQEYLVKNHCDGSMYRNPKSYAEVLFLFKVFQTEYKDYAAVKKQQRAEAKLKAEQEELAKEQQELVAA